MAAGMPGKQAPKAPKSNVAEILRRLDEAYPDPKVALHFSNPLELLVATILSAQCTDERVNKVTQSLFQRYRTAGDYARAKQAQLEKEIQSTGFFRSKTRSLQGACRMLEEHHGGQVPKTMEELVELPGVARKTANVVLGSAYGIASGIVVDTHVRRVSQRLGLTRFDDPVKIEQELCGKIPRARWISFGLCLILHGRHTCVARKPKCYACTLNSACPYPSKTVNSKPKTLKPKT